MKLIRIILSAAVVIAAVACSPSKEDGVTFSVSPTELTFTKEGGEASLSIKANGSWTVSTVGAWLKAAPTSGRGDQTLVVNASANTGSSVRNGSISVSIPGAGTKTVTISQEAGGGTDPDPSSPEGEEILSQDFQKAQGGFTVDNRVLPTELTYIWAQTAQYGMKASAYYNNTSYAAESWLISPEIDLTSKTEAHLSFSHTGQYFGTMTDEATLKVTIDNGTNWTTVAIPNYMTGKDWNFVDAGDVDLTPFCGHKVKFAFIYKSSTSSAATWEIKKLYVGTAYVPQEEGTTPSSSTDKGDKYTATPKWLELPALAEGKKAIIHTFNMNGKDWRNYSFLYDYDALDPLWVAYPLCDMYTAKNVTRQDTWAPDPFIPRDKQAIFFRAGDIYSRNPQYNRGHMLPSANRLGSKEMNQQTFYYTNITPQLANTNFNSGIWEALENMERKWSTASRYTDTLYVVTGCVVGDGLEIRKDNDGKDVKVPEGFYKVFLRYNSKAIGSKYSACAFYFDHKTYVDNSPAAVKTHVMSVDQIETKTGIDFFPNLADIIGPEAAATIEAEDPSSVEYWWN